MLVQFCKAVGQALDPQESGWIAGCGLTSLAQLVVFLGNLGESNIIFFDSSWVKQHTFNGLGWENQPEMDFPMKYLGIFLNSLTWRNWWPYWVEPFPSKKAIGATISLPTRCLGDPRRRRGRSLLVPNWEWGLLLITWYEYNLLG